MLRKSMKCAALAAVAGTMLQFGGCNLSGLLDQAVSSAVQQVGADMLGNLLDGLNLGGTGG